MESKMVYRDAAGSDVKLPKEVYYRCLWTVRDSERLRKLAVLLEDTDRAEASAYKQDLLVLEADIDADATLVSDDVAERAARELKCIDRALSKIPEVYQEGLLDNIIDKEPFGDFAHPNTWKRWKLVFLYELAKELRLI